MDIIPIIITAILSFFMSLADTFLIFFPPATITIGGIIGLSDLNIITIFISGFFIALGNVTAIFIFRTIGYKFLKVEKFNRFKKWQKKISYIIDNFGYYPIMGFSATTMNVVLSTTFLFAKEVNYPKYLFYAVIGRTTILSFCVVFFGITSDIKWQYMNIVIILYIIIFTYILIKVILDRKNIKYVFKNLKIIK
ncbi:MAG: hypothetical protein ACRCUP_03915 [Mycoplasmatales bacterium]